MANPFKAVAGLVSSSSSTRTVTIANATASGDTLGVIVAVNNTTCIPSACADSQGNVYTLNKSFTTTLPTLYSYLSQGATGGSGGGATAALTTSDTVTITTNAVSGAVDIYVVDIPGVGALDVSATIATGTSTTPSVSATPTVANDTMVSYFATAFAGGAPTVNSPFTSLGAFVSGSNPYDTVAYDVLSGGSGVSQTSTMTITSAAWRGGMWGFKPGSSLSPYTIVSGNTAAGTTTSTTTISHSAALGDTLVIGAGCSGTGVTVTGISDSQGNTYTLATSDYNQSTGLAAFTCRVTTALTSGTDTITATFSGTTGAKTVQGRGCAGISSNPLDVAIANDATSSTALSVGPSSTLAQASEWAVAFSINGNGGGAPTTWTGGFTLQDTQSPAANQFQEVADQVVSATTALTAGATIGSANHWAMLLVTLKAGGQIAPVMPLDGPVRSRIPGPFRKGSVQSNPGVRNQTGPPLKGLGGPPPYNGPVKAMFPGVFRKGRTQSSPGKYNQVGPPLTPPKGPVSSRIPGPFRKGRTEGINSGVYNQVGPPLKGLDGPPPYNGPVRSLLPESFRKGGKVQSNPGVFNNVGPPLKPQSGPIRARILQTFSKGRVKSTPPYVTPFVPPTAAPAPPWHGPVGLGQRAPGPFRKGRVQSSPGTRQQTGPQLTPLQGPVRSRILRTWSKGHAQFNAGKYGQLGPPLTPPKGPVTARRPGPFRKGGQVSSNKGVFNQSGPPLKPLPGPIRATRPGPYRKGQVQSNAGVFNQIGPKLKALAGPIRSRLPGPFRKGSAGAGNKGAPVFIPPPPPGWPPIMVKPTRQHFGARLLPSRRRRWDPRWPQGPQGQAWPSYTTQKGKHPRAYLRLLPSNRRRFREAWGQGNRGSAWPTAPRMAGSKPRVGARLRRGKFFIPTPPQANRGTPYFIFEKARPRRIMRTAVRNRVFKGWPQGNQGQSFPTPPRQSGKRPRVALRLIQSRRRRFDFPFGQANRGTKYPTFTQTASTHRRFAARLMQSRRRQWTTVPPQANRGTAFASYIRGKGPKIRLLARLRQSRQRRWLATYKHVTSSQTILWNVESHLISTRQINWNVLSHVVSSIAIEWNVGITVQSRPRLMTMEGWEQGMNAARLMTEEGKGYMGGGE